MYAIKTIVLAFATFAATAAAAPHPQGPSVEQAVNQCSGNDMGQTQVSCCDTTKTETGGAGGLLGGGLLNNLNLLGGQCSPIALPLNIIGGAVAIPITDYCTNQAACCSGDQTVSETMFDFLKLAVLSLTF